MNNNRIVVVGHEDSDTSRNAVSQAIYLTEMLDATLHVVHAFKQSKQVNGNGLNQNRIAELTTAQAKEMAKWRVPVKQFTLVGSPSETLVSHAEAVSATLIVVGNKNMHGMRRIFGSVGSGVAHNAPCDVYVVDTV